MIFQDPMTSLNPFLKISTQLTEVTRLHLKHNEQQARAHAIKMLKLVGISDAEDRMDSYPHEFSLCLLRLLRLRASALKPMDSADEDPHRRRKLPYASPSTPKLSPVPPPHVIHPHDAMVAAALRHINAARAINADTGRRVQLA